MKDLIIGCSTNYDWSRLKYWINSINKSGFDGEKVMVLMNCDKETIKKIIDSGFKVIGMKQDSEGNLVHQSNMMVHVERFIHMYNFIKDQDFRYIITTDVKDVVFQKNPSAWLDANLGDKNLVFSSESMLYENESWGNQNLYETFGPYVYNEFKRNEIYNVGVLAGRGFAVRDLMMNIFVACQGKPIPICDQSTFNFLISQHPYLHTSRYMKSEDGWACQLGTTADPSKIDSFRPFLLENEPKMVDGKVVTSKGKEFTIVHQYDRVPAWRSVIEATYG
jgi:hypothetical protein